jgi:hypothetical protein
MLTGQMSRKNLELVRRATQHFQRTGEPWWEMLDPEIEIYDHDIPDAGEYRGADGFRAWVAHWGEAWESFSIEPEEYIDAGDQVVEVVRLSARGKGAACRSSDSTRWCGRSATERRCGSTIWIDRA